jgi:hypothetical protein
MHHPLSAKGESGKQKKAKRAKKGKDFAFLCFCLFASHVQTINFEKCPGVRLPTEFENLRIEN